MTVSALGFFVFIIICMAGITFRLCILEAGGGVALVTGGYCVLANKRKFCQIVIKVFHMAPAGLIVTAVALLALLAFMDIVHPVAAITIPVQLGFMHITLVANITL